MKSFDFKGASRKLRHTMVEAATSQQVEGAVTVGQAKDRATATLTYDVINKKVGRMRQDGGQIEEDDVFKINCKDLVIGEEFALHLAAITTSEEPGQQAGGKK